jgi:hypothetical protein
MRKTTKDALLFLVQIDGRGELGAGSTVHKNDPD